jgi:hypothetical protein
MRARLARDSLKYRLMPAVEGLQSGAIHQRTRTPKATVARPRAAPSTAALKRERAGVGIPLPPNLAKRLTNAVTSSGLQCQNERGLD